MILVLPLAMNTVVLLFLVSVVQADVPVNRCVYVDHIRKNFNGDIRNCSSHEICKERSFNVSYIYFPPYYFDNMDIIEEPPVTRILRQCCGRCVKFENIQIFKNLSEVTEESMQTSDFIYPFFAHSTTPILHGYHYIPYIDVPPVMLITKRRGIDLAGFVRQVFPITLVCILASIVSGFICWILETWSNPDEFPRPFLIGWFDGFWWSFISMTTVGYGDKAPKTFWGRIFSVLWISMGMICYGLLTGIVYAEVMEVNSPPPPQMEGKRIGSLLYRDYDAIIVADNGGILYPQGHPTPEPAGFYEDAVVMINKLQQEELDGFVLDKYTYGYLQLGTDSVMWKNWQFNLISREDSIKSFEFFRRETVTTSVPYKGTDRLTYGILVRHQQDYEYFVDMVREKSRREEAIMVAMWNYYRKYSILKTPDNRTFRIPNDSSHQMNLYQDGANNLFSAAARSFRITVMTIGGMILGIVTIGCILELKRNK